LISKVDSAHATKAYGRAEVYFHPFIATALDTGGKVQVPIFYTRRKIPRYSMNSSLSGFWSHSGTFAVRKIHFPMPESETWFLGYPDPSLHTVPTDYTLITNLMH
jgi:hypothetical protein